MEKVETKIPEVLILKSSIFKDSRGFFTETLNVQELKNANLNFEIAQINHSFNEKTGTLRGLHFQVKPFAQAKIVTCIEGAIFDVAIDVRPQSPTFLKFVSFLLVSPREEFKPNKLDFHIKYDYLIQYPEKIYIPRGFAHGYLTLLPSTEILYITDNYYSKQHDRTIRYDDPKIGIPWPRVVENFILSDKDINAPFSNNFDFSEI